jgi:lipoprotein signal peptidase
VLGDLFRPKSFAGLFGAAPSVAVATLAIAFWNQGAAYAALEGRSMMIRSLALCFYSVAACQLMKRYELPALAATVLSLIVWTLIALGGKWLLFG